MTRNLYTQDEIVLCTYIAIYGRAILAEKKIASTFKRSEASVIMKVQNIAAMLDEEGVQRFDGVSALSGKPTGEEGRRTNWEEIKNLVELGKDQHKKRCIEIVRNAS